MSVFQDHILNAGDTCNSCFSLIRRERSRTQSGTLRSDVTVQKTAYTRVETTTEIAHGPSESMSGSIGVWCRCGQESAYDRYWCEHERCLTMERFKDYLVNLVETYERKKVDVDRETLVKLAIHEYRDEHDVNGAFEAATRAAVGVATSRPSPDAKTEPLR